MKKAKPVYYDVLRTLEKCRKHSLGLVLNKTWKKCVISITPDICEHLSNVENTRYISFVFSNARRVLSQCNTRLGCVHTWCPSTSARAPAQNGAVQTLFRLWVPDMLLLPSSARVQGRDLVLGHGHRA